VDFLQLKNEENYCWEDEGMKGKNCWMKDGIFYFLGVGGAWGNFRHI
jgi:hypothetical protein